MLEEMTTEAKRIWTTASKAKWAELLNELPETKTINRKEYKYRDEVRFVLQQAVNLTKNGGDYLGMNRGNYSSSEPARN